MWFHIILVTIAALYFLWTRRHLYALSWQLNGPTALPILGSALALWNCDKNVTFFDKLASKYKSPTRIWLGSDLYLFVHDAPSIETLMRSRTCVNKPFLYQGIREALGGDGLFTAKDDQWRAHRKYVVASMKDSAIAAHSSIFNYFFRELCADQLARVANDGRTIDILLPLNVCYLSMYLEASYGQEWTQSDEYAKLLHKTMAQISRRMFRPWLGIKWIRMFTEYERVLDKFRKYGDDVVKRIINRSVDESTNNGSFLEKLIAIAQENPDYTINDVMLDAHTLVLAASDTTSVGLKCVLLMLAIHPDDQQKLFEELLTVMPSKEMDLNMDAFNRLPFMDACVREAMRLFPPVPLIARAPTESIVLNGTEIPAGIPIVIGIRQVQRCAEYWGNDAHVFRPERFLVDNPPHKEHPGCYLPFSFGLRNCIGYGYAMYTVKLGLAHIVRNYRLTSPLQLADLKIRLNISFRFLSGAMVQLHPRTE